LHFYFGRRKSTEDISKIHHRKMKWSASNRSTAAMTLTEVIVVTAIIFSFIAAFIFLDNLNYKNEKRIYEKAMRINYVSNLKQIGLAFKLWEGDNGDKFPMEVSLANGGAMELVATGNITAIFQVMSNELGTPKLLICPADSDHSYATNFGIDFNNLHISYFVGAEITNEMNPQMILSGDDNFEISGVPIKSGLLEFSTNAPISWSAERHHFVGNIGLADGNVQ
jgi:hypothetical protein